MSKSGTWRHGLGQQRPGAAERFAGDHLKDGGGADLYVDVSRSARGDGEVPRHEVEASVAAFVENHFAFAVEDEDIGSLEIFREPIPEDVDALKEAGARRGGGRWLGRALGNGRCGRGLRYGYGGLDSLWKGRNGWSVGRW